MMRMEICVVESGWSGCFGLEIFGVLYSPHLERLEN